MLNQRELEWLESRKDYSEGPNFYYFCKWCPVRERCSVALQGRLRKPFCLCPLSLKNNNYQEAAEFEAKVAAKLAYLAEQTKDGDNCFDCPCTHADFCFPEIRQECSWVFLKTARLQVEAEEMG